MTRFEQIKKMSIDEFSIWFAQIHNLCEFGIECGKCQHKEFCGAPGSLPA